MERTDSVEGEGSAGAIPVPTCAGQRTRDHTRPPITLDEYVAEALSIAQDGGADERETWVAQVIDAAAGALARPIRASSLLGVGPMVNRALRERALATSLASSVADLLDPGQLISG